MTERPEPNDYVMLNQVVNLIQDLTISASDLFFLLSADTPFVSVPACRQTGTERGFGLNEDRRHPTIIMFLN